MAQSFTTTCLWEIVHVFGHLENQTFFFFNGQKKNNRSLINWQKIQHRGYFQYCYYNLFSITFSCSYLFFEEYFHRGSLWWQFILNILMSVTVLYIIHWVGISCWFNSCECFNISDVIRKQEEYYCGVGVQKLSWVGRVAFWKLSVAAEYPA